MTQPGLTDGDRVPTADMRVRISIFHLPFDSFLLTVSCFTNLLVFLAGDSWGNKEGSYTLRVGDGRERVVKYTADGAGFRASIKTNEPGIVASNPAAVNINTAGGYGSGSGSYSHQAPVYTTHVGGYSQQGGKWFDDSIFRLNV